MASRLVNVYSFETQEVAGPGFDMANRFLPPITFKESYILLTKLFIDYIPTKNI